MPLLPMGPPPGGGLATPMGPPQGLMPPGVGDAPDLAPAGAMVGALGPLAAQQQAVLDAVKQKLAEEAMAAAMSAVQEAPNPLAAAAQSEPSGLPPAQPGAPDQGLPSGGY